MLNKNKLLNLIKLLEAHFILPFLGSTVVVLLITLLFDFKTNLLSSNQVLVLEGLALYAFFLFWFRKIPETHQFKKIVYKNKIIDFFERTSTYFQKISKYIGLSIVLIIAIFAAIYTANSIVNRSYWVDEAITVMVGRNVAETGLPKIDGGSLYTSYPLHTYLLGAVYKFFGVSHISSRVPSLIVFLAMIFVLFLTLRKYSTTIALTTSFLYTFSLWNLGWATQARQYIFFAFLYYLFFYFFLKAYTKGKKYNNFVPPFFLLVLITLLNGASLLLIILSIVLFILIDKPKEVKTTIGSLWLQRKKYIKYSPFVLIPLVVLFIYELPTLKNIPHFLQIKNFFGYYISYFNKLHPILILFFVIGVISFFVSKKISSTQKKYLVSFVVFPFVFLSIFNIYPGGMPFDRYIFFLYPFFIILSAIGIYCFASFLLAILKNNTFKKILISTLCALIILYISKNDTGIKTAPQKDFYKFAIFDAPFPDYSPVFEYLKNNSSDKDTIITTRSVIARVYIKHLDYILEPTRDSEEYNKIKSAMLINPKTDPKDDYGTGSHIFGTQALIDIVNSTSSGYLVWDWDLGDHLDPDTYTYMEENLKKITIPGVDEKMIRLYSWGK